MSAEEILALVEAATPGPWFTDKQEAERTCGYMPPQHPNSIRSYTGNICGLHDGGQTRESIDANAHFIAAARDAVPALCARVSELETALTALVEACERWAGEDGSQPLVPRRVANALDAARSLLSHQEPADG